MRGGTDSRREFMNGETFLHEAGLHFGRSLSSFPLQRKCCAIEQNGSPADTVCGVVIIKAVVDLRRAASDIR
jgi:hypothetical protein